MSSVVIETMATADTRSDDEWEVYLQEEIGMAKQPARDLVDEFPSEDGLVEFLVEDGSLTDIEGVGDTSAVHLRNWFEANYPEAERQRLVNSKGICTEFTTDHGLADEKVDDDKFYFAFVCPQCDNSNALVGDPSGFYNRPFRCRGCSWVSALAAEFLEEFREEHYDGDE